MILNGYYLEFDYQCFAIIVRFMTIDAFTVKKKILLKIPLERKRVWVS